jgi:hypothetical protein
MSQPTEPSSTSTADTPRRARRERIDPKTTLQAAQAVGNLSEQSLASVAAAKGITIFELRRRLDQKLFELAESGDIEAIRLLAERTSGVALGRIERCRTAKSMHRRVLRALADGQLSVTEASRLAGLVRLKRELEHDTLDERLAEVEGSLVERVVDG